MEPDQTMAEADRMGEVDQHPSVDAVTEADEEQVLAELYGEPDEDGFYTADPGDDPEEES